MRRGLALSLFAIFVVSAAMASEADLAPWRDLLERSGFPENDEARRFMASAITAPSYPAVEVPYRIHRQISDGRTVRFETRRAAADWYLLFRNQRGWTPFETYPVWGRGSWVIKKSLLTGEYIQAKVFLQDEEGTFVRLYPLSGGRTQMDLHLYGRRIGDDVVLPASFEELCQSPFARVLYLSQHAVDWEALFPDPHQVGYKRSAALVDGMAGQDDRINEYLDGALDGSGRNVTIEDRRSVVADHQGRVGFNCSGYVKFLIDGIVAAWENLPGALYLDLDPLLEPTDRLVSNPWNESRSAFDQGARAELDVLLRDPWFGLDWNRNLAYAAEEARLGRPLESVDRAALEQPVDAGLPFQDGMGYPLEDLDAVLYFLASQRPGALWLAAVNSRFVPPASPDDPTPLPLHQFWHVSALVPWFEDGSAGGEPGRFRVAVLDVGRTTPWGGVLTIPEIAQNPSWTAKIQALALEYADLGRDDQGNVLVPEVRVHLIRVDIPSNFSPVSLPVGP